MKYIADSINRKRLLLPIDTKDGNNVALLMWRECNDNV